MLLVCQRLARMIQGLLFYVVIGEAHDRLQMRSRLARR
jgi:hypothetical protein